MSNENQPPSGVAPKFMGTAAAAAAGMTIVPRHVLGAGLPGAQRHGQRRRRRLRARHGHVTT